LASWRAFFGEVNLQRIDVRMPHELTESISSANKHSKYAD